MGDSALSAFLEVLFDRVASRSVKDFFEDNKLDCGLLRKWKTKLLAVNKVLDVAEVKQIADKHVKEWLQELQDVLYEFDDLLDAVNTEAMQRQLEKKNKISSTRNMDELSRKEAKLKVLDDAKVKQIANKNVKESLQDAAYESDDQLDAVNTEAMRSQLQKENQSSPTRNMDELSSKEAKFKVLHDAKVKQIADKNVKESLQDAVYESDNQLDAVNTEVMRSQEKENQSSPTRNMDELSSKEAKFKVLHDAKVKQIADKNVKESLQDAVYESDDQLDAVNTEAMRSQLKKENQSSPTRNMDELSSTKAKLKEILQRLEDIVEEIDHLGLEIGVPVHENPNKSLPTTSLPDEVFVGRDKDKESIVELLLAEKDSLDVITIKGMGGVGKTTLAQHVYDDDKIVKKFDFRAWVWVSEQFDVSKVTRAILQAVTSSLPIPDYLNDASKGTRAVLQAVTSSLHIPDDLNLMQKQLKDNLIGKKILVVLDDVWNENRDQWELLKKPLQGNKIIVTTRNEGVAQIMRTVPTHSLEKLSDEYSWKLFAEYAFEGGKSQAKQDLKDKILKKCGGLPLAAKALGGLLRDKKTEEEWINIVDSNVRDLEDKNCNILAVLRVSYHFLPPRLKLCFAFASIFPKDYQFGKEELILLWAAHSFFPEEKKWEDTGDEYFNELLSRSFFQPSTDDSSLFVMPDLMHDLATFVSGKSCCCCVTLENIKEITNTTRHISYFQTSSELLQTLPTTNTLRTFTQHQQGYPTPSKLCPQEISDVLLTRFKSLRVLSLRKYEIAVLPKTIGSLKHLRYFDLSHTKIKRLPSSLCDLYNLQILFLTSCRDLIELPKHMCKLVNLHYLDVTGCYELREMPRNLGKLKNLPRLGRFKEGKDSEGANIGEWAQCSFLGGPILGLENVGSTADATEVRLTEDKELSFRRSWTFLDDPGKDYMELEKLQPDRSVEKLTIRFYGGGKFPNWIKDQMYSNMVSLKLEDCKRCRSMPALGQLPSLKELYIIRFTSLETLGSEFYGNSYAAKPFGSLEILQIQDMAQWELWCQIDDKAFALLQEFQLEGCPKLRGNLPAELPSLMNFRIVGCPDLIVSPPEVTPPSDLSSWGWNSNLEMLPENHMPQRLQSSKNQFDHLTSLPDVLYSALTSLEISDCGEFMEDLRSLQGFNSLKNLTIGKCRVVSFPAEGFLPGSLTCLTIKRFDDLETLEYKGLEGLTSLSKLTVRSCRKLKCIPPEGLPASLDYLCIEDCPLLEPRLYKEDGDKIKHIYAKQINKTPVSPPACCIS